MARSRARTSHVGQHMACIRLGHRSDLADKAREADVQDSIR